VWVIDQETGKIRTKRARGRNNGTAWGVISVRNLVSGYLALK